MSPLEEFAEARRSGAYHPESQKIYDEAKDKNQAPKAEPPSPIEPPRPQSFTTERVIERPPRWVDYFLILNNLAILILLIFLAVKSEARVVYKTKTSVQYKVKWKTKWRTKVINKASPDLLRRLCYYDYDKWACDQVIMDPPERVSPLLRYRN